MYTGISVIMAHNNNNSTIANIVALLSGNIIAAMTSVYTYVGRKRY